MRDYMAICVILVMGLINQVQAKTTLVYQLTVDEASPHIVMLTVNTISQQALTWLPPRTMHSSQPPSLTCLSPEGQTLPLVYHTPTHCQSVTASLPLQAITDTGFDLTTQQDSYHPQQGWYFVSEWDSLPRVKEAVDIQVCTPDKQCELMPPRQSPPLLLVWGMKRLEIPIHDQRVTLDVDSDVLLQRQSDWLPILAQQLTYISTALQSEALSAPWAMAVFVREQQTGSLGGIAGANRILVNVTVDKGQLTPKSLPYFLKIAAHESVHRLAPYDFPTWVSESLAEYYALKSLAETPYAFDNPLQIWQQFATRYPYADTGLLDAADLVMQGQAMYYPLFYFKGAAFWYELEQALQAISQQDLALQLPNFVFKHHQLTAQSIAHIQSLIGQPAWQKLMTKYLLSH